MRYRGSATLDEPRRSSPRRRLRVERSAAQTADVALGQLCLHQPAQAGLDRGADGRRASSAARVVEQFVVDLN